jgi:hypothetical protein
MKWFSFNLAIPYIVSLSIMYLEKFICILPVPVFPIVVLGGGDIYSHIQGFFFKKFFILLPDQLLLHLPTDHLWITFNSRSKNWVV